MMEPSGNISQLDSRDRQPIGPIRLFAIADQDIYVDGLVRVISDHPCHQVVACISPGEDCYQKFCATPADILLVQQSVIERRLAHKPVDDLFSQYHQVMPTLRIIVFGHDIADAYVRRMFRAGIHGFIDSSMTQESLAAAIQEVHSGGYWVGRQVLEQLIYSAVEMEHIVEQGIQDKIQSIQETLTRRETDVLQRVLEGMSTRQIADDLYLSEQSVKLHLGRMFRKFEVTNRSQLILMAFQRVCPATNIINLFRKALDRRRINKGQQPLIDDPMTGLR
jgi:DNA-binding NarL/FixJ family response regulator